MVRQRWRSGARWWSTPQALAALLNYTVIGLVALVPRILDLGGLITLDEANFWIRRSETFLQAIRSGDYAATAISTHPGVTTMWLGSLGMLLHHELSAWGLVTDPSFATRLALLRLPVVLTHVAGILLGYWMLRRLLHPTTALLAAILWAADPFVIGYSRLLHVDALMGTFATLSVLAACCYWYHTRRIAWLLLSGTCAGLATLSKSPALVLIALIGVLALLNWWRHGRRNPWWHGLTLVVWSVALVATVVALWPALWAAPMEAINQVRIGVEVEGAEPHLLGNFFLGREDLAPGPLFYPVALVLRLTPWTFVGLLLLPVAYVMLNWFKRGTCGVQRALRREMRGTIFALACFVVLFVIALSPFPKKFNRYLVPAFPALDILAAVGLSMLWIWIVALERWCHTRVGNTQGADTLEAGHTAGIRVLQFRLFPSVSRSRGTVQASVPVTAASPRVFVSAWIITILIGLSACINAIYWHPYGIAAFNQALGGAEAGERTFVIGWGEGLEQVAAWLNQQPDITGVITASTVTPTLQPYLRSGAQATTPSTSELPPKTGYVVIYAHDVQAGPPWPPFNRFYGHIPPVYTVWIHGVAYAWIYQVPPDVATPHPADFGDAIHLRGFELLGEPRVGGQLHVKLFWETRRVPAANYTLFAHLIGPGAVKTLSQVDLPYSTTHWGTRRFVTTELVMDVPQRTKGDAPSVYNLMIGLYDPATGKRLSLNTSVPADTSLDGPDALMLVPLAIP